MTMWEMAKLGGFDIGQDTAMDERRGQGWCCRSRWYRCWDHSIGFVYCASSRHQGFDRRTWDMSTFLLYGVSKVEQDSASRDLPALAVDQLARVEGYCLSTRSQ